MKKSLAFNVLTRVSSNALLVLVVLLTILPAGVAARAEDKLSVMVSILPQVWFVEQIGGDLVTVEALVGPGHSPATFEPTAKQMVRLQNTQVFFSAGVPFEQVLLPRISASQSAPPIHGPRPVRGSHSHHHGHDHSSELDPHTWLDPLKAQAMADTIGQILGELVPQRADYFHRRTLELKTRLANLQVEITNILKPVHGKTFFVFHPAYGYFADAYGLEQVAVEIEGRVPTGKALTKFIQMARHENAKVIFVQPQFSEKSAATIARAISGAVVPLDPLAGDYIGNMTDMAIKIETALKP
jgi:zinc transport system substrate-binding protein